MSRADSIIKKIENSTGASLNALGAVPTAKKRLVKVRGKLKNKKPLEESNQLNLVTGPSSGTHKHFHKAFVDSSVKEGQTTSTEGDGPEHDHGLSLKREDSSFQIYEVQAGGDDAHTHPNISVNKNQDSYAPTISEGYAGGVVAKSVMEKFQSVKNVDVNGQPEGGSPGAKGIMGRFMK